MIVTRTPFRITLGGGGTDLPSFYRNHGGYILAAGIDKYMYLNVNMPIVDDIIRVKYSINEQVQYVDEIKHDLAREALKLCGIKTGLEVISLADIPAGTGLGSSSCYLVGLLKALHALAQQGIGAQALAEEACHIELETLRKPIGKQDQYMAAFGGLTQLDIAPDGVVQVTRLAVPIETIEELENNTLLFYTGTVRDAQSILSGQDSATRRNDADVIARLLEIKEMGYEIRDAILQGKLRRFGELMDMHWQAKKQLAAGISNSRIDEWYKLAKRHGAIGGKITGAGGGGFLMLYCEASKVALRDAMRRAGLRELNFRFEFEGSKTVFDIVQRDGRFAHMRRTVEQNHALTVEV